MKLFAYILLIYFSIGALLPRCDFSQLAQMDDLLRHYELHQVEAAQMNIQFTFWDFLALHFVTGEDHNHEQGNEHDQLPFQSFSTSLTLFLENPILPTENVSCFPQVKTSFLDLLADQGVLRFTFHPPTL